MAGKKDHPGARPAQKQERQPGRERPMSPQPVYIGDAYKGSGKLAGKVALITGGDSGIGRAVAVHFAREGADLSIVYLDEHTDAKDTRRLVEQEGRRCELISGDVGDADFCHQAVKTHLERLGRLDVLVNNAAEQHVQTRFEDISLAQVEQTFRTNFFAYFSFAKAALPHLEPGGAIINTASVTAYRGSSHLIDYSATKGAIVAFTRSLASALAERGIRVNGVAPGPIWTPLIPATFGPEHVQSFGSDTLLGRAGQPAEVAPCYVLLASADGAYMTGQVLHPNGGDFIGT
jgi:NAD(P)-dependent dehydrogenase (short-subunit alcohol dehydrogenase family)